MPPHRSIAAEYASAVAHPVRYQLVGALSNGPRPVEALASELDLTEAVVMRHAEALREQEILEAHEHDGTRSYELLRDPVVWDGAWAQLPLEARRGSVAASVVQMSAAAAAAVDRGGFDRGDIHLTRTAAAVDEERWAHMVRIMNGTLLSLGDLVEQPEPSGETFQATAIMMLFTDERAVHAAPGPPAAAGGADEETVPRAWELMEELQDALTTAPVDWERVDSLTGQLRMIARVSKDPPPPAAVVPIRRD